MSVCSFKRYMVYREIILGIGINFSYNSYKSLCFLKNEKHFNQVFCKFLSQLSLITLSEVGFSLELI